MELTKKEYLEKVLETYKMSHIEKLLKKYTDKRDTIKKEIEEKYKSKIYIPINSGSFAKHTAINNKFDLDIAVPFKKDSFDTLEDMFDDIFKLLNDKYEKDATIKKQKVSIGIQFHSDEDDDVISLDIVPGRELNKDQYSDDKKLNLYVNSKYGTLAEKSYIQTNINAQIEHIKAKENERKIIRLLKIWKTNNYEKYKSFLLELITIKAFNQKSISGDLWEKLKCTLEYIEDNIAKENFTLQDPGNSNNDVSKTLEIYEKQLLVSKMRTILDRIEDNEDNIKTYFPLNKDFEKEEKSDNGYGLKGSVIGASIPPDNQRFG